MRRLEFLLILMMAMMRMNRIRVNLANDEKVDWGARNKGDYHENIFRLYE